MTPLNFVFSRDFVDSKGGRLDRVEGDAKADADLG